MLLSGPAVCDDIGAFPAHETPAVGSHSLPPSSPWVCLFGQQSILPRPVTGTPVSMGVAYLLLLEVLAVELSELRGFLTEAAAILESRCVEEIHHSLPLSCLPGPPGHLRVFFCRWVSSVVPAGTGLVTGELLSTLPC